MPSDKNHVDSFETDGSLHDLPSRLGNLFDLGIPAFDWGIPAFPILEICLVCAARFGHS